MVSNREIEDLFDRWNPNKIRTGDRVRVKMSGRSYLGRVVGLDLDVKNEKVYVNLKLMDNTKRNPSRVDASDCHRVEVTYPGHHNNI